LKSDDDDVPLHSGM